MKKMRLFFMGAVAGIAMIATMSLTSCNKEDVTYNQQEEEVLYMGVDGKDANIECPLCHLAVQPGHYHSHYYADGICGIGAACSHWQRPHYHIFQNATGTNTGGTWLILTTHYGRTIPAEGDHEGFSPIPDPPTGNNN